MHHRPQSSARREGFTILEVVLVIAVIGLLAAMLTPSIQGLGASASTGARVHDAAVINRLLDGIDTALDANGGAPASYADLAAVAAAIEGDGTTIVVNGDALVFRLPVGATVSPTLNFAANRVQP